MINKIFDYLFYVVPFVLLPTVRFIPSLWTSMKNCQNSLAAEIYAFLLLLIIINTIGSGAILLIGFFKIKRRFFK